jgi:hypothetical protein
MRIPFLLIFCFIHFGLFAQNSAVKNQEFSFSIGIGELDIEKLSPNENLDFINYVDSDPEYTDFVIFKLGYKFDFFSKMSADIKLIMMDDIIPDNYDISVHYFIRPWFGVGVGSMLNKNWITYFEEYQIQTLPDYYLVDYNVQQFTAYDLGFYLSPLIKPIDNNIFKLQISCDLGLSSFMKEEAIFYHKKKLSNERLQYHYETNTDYQPYIQPKIEIRLKAFKIKDTSIGFLLNSNYYYSNRSINYFRTIQKWTSVNKITEQIESSKHNYSRFEFNMGIFLRW